MENRVKVMITKENGHPVSLWYKSLLHNKTKSQEACNVQYEYSTLFPLLSNSNYRPICLSTSSRILDQGCSRQAISPHLSSVWSESRPCSQLGTAMCPGSEFGFDPSLSALPFSKDLLPGLRTDCCRRSGSVPSLFPSDQTIGRVYPWLVPIHDGQGGSRTSWLGLENRQKHR